MKKFIVYHRDDLDKKPIGDMFFDTQTEATLWALTNEMHYKEWGHTAPILLVEPVLICLEINCR